MLKFAQPQLVRESLRGSFEFSRCAWAPCRRIACVDAGLGLPQSHCMTVETPAAAAWPNAKLVAICCGIGAAACWAVGLTAARHGIAAGLTPMDLAFHRFMWSGLPMLPLAWRWGLSDLGGIGWGTGLVLMVLGGPGLTILSHAGFLLAPL